jgi:ABC-type transport system involved in Fe-S cluster assembly fused permease/ATPase subunit
VKINVYPKVLQVLDGISYLGVTLDLGNLEFFMQTIACHASSEGYTGAQQDFVHHVRLALVLSLHLSGHVGSLFLQISNIFKQISSIFPAILSKIDPFIVSSRVVIFPVILLMKVIFVVITVVSMAAMLLFPIYAPLGLSWNETILGF